MNSAERTATSTALRGVRPWRMLSGAQLGGIGGIAVVVVGAYLFGHFQGGGGPSNAGSPCPNVGFKPSDIDLGDQMWAQVVPLQVTFVNGGTESIVVESIQSACDCVVVENADCAGSTVQAGETLTIDVQLHTQKNPGEKVRRIELTTTAGARYNVAVRVNVRGTWSYSPDALDFGEVVVDGAEVPAVRAVVFESSSDELTDVSCAGAPWLECETATTGPGSVQIVVRIVPERLSVGQNSASLVLRTSSAVKPTGVVFVKARGSHELSTRPGQVLLVGNKRQRVEFFDRDGRRARIVSVDVADVGLRAQPLPDGAVEIWNDSGQPLTESVSVRVVDEAGRVRVFRVSAF